MILKNGNVDVEYKGEKLDGIIMINKSGQVAVSLYQNNYCAIKNFDDQDYVFVDNISNGEEECKINDDGSNTHLEFVFDIETNTITGYTGESVDVVIPEKIVRNNVEYEVLEIGQGAFSSKEIETLVIAESVKEIKNFAFSSNKIEDLIIPDSVEDIGLMAFSGNPIKTLHVGSNLRSFLTDITDPIPISQELLDNDVDQSACGWASMNVGFINNRSNLETITVSPDNPYFVAINNNVYTKDMKWLVIGSKFSSNNIEEGIIGIGQSAFDNAPINSVTIPSTVKYIKKQSFAGTNLVNVIIPDSVEIIENNVFRGAPIENLYIGSGITDIYSRVVDSPILSTVTINKEQSQVRYFKSNCIGSFIGSDVIFLQ